MTEKDTGELEVINDVPEKKPDFITSLFMMPMSIPFIVGNEAAERFSFYGMKTILATFMTKFLLDKSGETAFLSENMANVYIHLFVAAVYFTPFFGAILSDWLVGKYRMICYLSIFYCAGHLLLAFIDLPKMGIPLNYDPEIYLLLGLGFIAVGSGGIKPCVSSNVGDQFNSSNKFLIPVVFSLFYFSINFGSFFSTLLTPLLLNSAGPGWAFGIPGILMGLATIIFISGNKHYVKVPPAGNKFFAETFSWDGIKAILNLLPLYFFVAMFWALFDQTASTWVHQAKHMNRSFWLFSIYEDQIQAANPLLVMILIPLFNTGLYPFINHYIELTPLRKIGIGFFLTIPAFLIPGLIELMIANGNHVHIVMQLIAYVFITAAEVMISITVLEFSYTQAPPKIKSLVMGLNLMSVSFGNLFVGYINHMIEVEHKSGNKEFLSGASYYWFFSACMLGTAILYSIWSFTYRGKTYLQDEKGDAA